MATRDGIYTPQYDETWYSQADRDKADATISSLSTQLQLRLIPINQTTHD